MKVFRCFIILMFVAFVFSCAGTGRSEEVSDSVRISDPVFEMLMNNSFEVVVDKMESDKLTYEKELPFNRIDYKIRNDKYIPIGTAFLLDDGYFYTAEHVMQLELRTQYENFYLRDRNGNIYPVDKIYAFSNHIDYICFSVVGFSTKGKGLKVAKSIDLNSPVYSVGNALGDGIIIRNGVFTSTTPESYDGKWSYLRFSAAANPGNSGGPLVKEDGSVVGIIVMVNNTQNLNYAVPIEEAQKGLKEKTGDIDSKYYSYTMPNIIDEKFYGEFIETVKVPDTLSNLRNTVSGMYDNVAKNSVSDIRDQYEPAKSKGFANTRGSAEILYNELSSVRPMVLYRNSAGLWQVGYLKDMNTVNLENNGYVKNLSVFNTSFCLLKKPDDVTLQQLIDSPKLCAEYFLEGAPLYRTVAGENIKITSFGEPFKSEKYVDYFGRTWFVNYFDLLYSDQMVISFALPIPGGVLEMCQVSSYGEALNCLYLDLQFLADSTTLSYSAKVKDWIEYLSLKNDMVRTSDAESSISVRSDKNGISVSAGKDLSVVLPESLVEIGPEGELVVSFSYDKASNGTVSLRASSILITTPVKAENRRMIYLHKVNKPTEGAQEDTLNDWHQLTNKIGVYSGEPYDNENETIAVKVILPENKTADKADYAYIFTTLAVCGNDKTVFRQFTEKAEASLKIK